MPLTFFEPKENPGNGNIPFLDDWLKENPKTKQQQFLVREIIKVKSDKGYLITTDDFNCFIWKNQGLTKFLIEALELWVKESEHGYAIYVYLKKPGKPEFTLAADKEEQISWFASKNGYTTMASNAISQGETLVDGNPFL